MGKGVLFIKQQHKYGCGVACLSMATNVGYDYIINMIPHPVVDFNKAGMSVEFLSSVLNDFGYLTEIRYKTKLHTQSKRSDWLIPFAPISIVQVDNHFVFMVLSWIYDPNKEFTESYGFEDINKKKIISIMGIWEKPLNNKIMKVNDFTNSLNLKQMKYFTEKEIKDFQNGSINYPYLVVEKGQHEVVEISEIIAINGMADNNGIPTTINVRVHKKGEKTKCLSYELKQ